MPFAEGMAHGSRNTAEVDQAMKPKVKKMASCKIYLHKSLQEVLEELMEYEGVGMSELGRSLLEEAAQARLHEHQRRIAFRAKYKQEQSK